MPESTTLAFATDIHHDLRVFRWLDWAVRSFDVVAIGGDLDYPCEGLRNLKLNVLRHALRPNTVKDRIFSVAKQTGRVAVVLGNHDRPDRRALHGTRVTVAGLVIGGVGGSLPVQPFPFGVTEEQYSDLLEKMGRVDVLIAHQPPFETKVDLSYTRGHAGSRAIRDYVEREGPRIVLSGHVHESPGVDLLGSTTLLNPGPFFRGKYGVAELTPDGVQGSIREFPS